MANKPCPSIAQYRNRIAVCSARDSMAFGRHYYTYVLSLLHFCSSSNGSVRCGSSTAADVRTDLDGAMRLNKYAAFPAGSNRERAGCPAAFSSRVTAVHARRPGGNRHGILAATTYCHGLPAMVAFWAFGCCRWTPGRASGWSSGVVVTGMGTLI